MTDSTRAFGEGNELGKRGEGESVIFEVQVVIGGVLCGSAAMHVNVCVCA
jgi:hypothetical protein